MFGKDYSKDIIALGENLDKVVIQLNKNTTGLDNLIKTLNTFQEDMMSIAKIQATHKQIITFLLNNVQVDPDAVKGLMTMLKEINKINKMGEKEPMVFKCSSKVGGKE